MRSGGAVRCAIGVGSALLLAACAAKTAPLPTAPEISPRIVRQDIAYPRLEVAFPGGVTGLPDVTYSNPVGYRPLKLDLYLPPPAFKDRGPRPVVVYVHGGGWLGGSGRLNGAFIDWPGVLASLATKGYVVAAISFRQSSEAPFPAAVQDLKTAVQWLRGSADVYNIDKKRVMTWGASSGGQIATLGGVSCGAALLNSLWGPAESDCVQGAVGWYGVYDFPALYEAFPSETPTANPYFGCPETCSLQHLRAPSPTTYVDRYDPPILLVHGDGDPVAPISQARTFDAALTAAGGKSRLIVIPGAAHAWLGATPEATRAASIEALQRTFDFFDEIIGDPPRP